MTCDLQKFKIQIFWIERYDLYRFIIFSRNIQKQVTGLMFSPRSVSINSSLAELANQFCQYGKTGVIQLTGFPAAPLGMISKLFDLISSEPEISQRFNDAYKNRLVYKDSFAAGKGLLLIGFYRFIF